MKHKAICNQHSPFLFKKYPILLILIFLIFKFTFSFGQSIKISDNGSVHTNPAAVLDIESNSKGILIPSMPFVEIVNNIPPFDGILVYNTSEHIFMYFNGASGLWEPVGNASNPGDSNKIIDNDQDTYVTVEQNTDDDTIRFYVEGVEQWRVVNKTLEPINSGNSVFIGEGAGKADAQSNQNVFIGHWVGKNSTTGSFNNIVGHNAFSNNITGDNNVGYGDYTLYKNTEGNNNTAIGSEVLKENTSGFNNVAVGYNALKNNKTVNSLVAIGDSALYNNGSSSVGFQGYFNTAVGSRTLFTNVLGFANTALGHNAMYTNSSGFMNTAIGVSALYKNASGIQNIALGNASLYSNSSGNDNIAFGVGSLNTNSTGNRNIAIGTNALYLNTTNHENIAIGNSALYSNSTGNSNTSIGDSSLYTNLSGSNNLAIGAGSLQYNETGNGNVAIGTNTLLSNNFGSRNIAIGLNALYGNSGDQGNIAIGAEALKYGGDGNVAIGDSSLHKNAFWAGAYEGNYNTAIGTKTLLSNTTGTNNTSIGYYSGLSCINGSENTFLGSYSGVKVTSGSNNAFFGYNSGSSVTIGDENIMIGSGSGASNNGDENVFIGHHAGHTNNGTGNVFIGNEAGASSQYSSTNNTLIISNSHNAAPLIKGDFYNNKLTINGDLNVTGRINEPEVGYFSMGAASFMVSNVILTSDSEVASSCDPDHSSYLPQDKTTSTHNFIDNSPSLRLSPFGNGEQKMSVYAPVNVPHLSTIDSIALYMRYQNATDDIYTCFSLIRTELSTGIRSEIASFRVTNNSNSTGVFAESVPNSFNTQGINHSVDNRNYVYSFEVNILGYQQQRYKILGAWVRYTKQ